MKTINKKSAQKAKSKKKLLELKRIIEYFVSGGVWFWSGYILIITLDDHVGLFWANAIGNAVGITLNFLLSRYWVFKTKKPSKLGVATRRYVVYTAINAFGLNYLILAVLQQNGIDPKIGQFIASAFFTVWNYIWYKHYVFKGLETHHARRRTKHHT